MYLHASKIFQMYRQPNRTKPLKQRALQRSQACRAINRLWQQRPHMRRNHRNTTSLRCLCQRRDRRAFKVRHPTTNLMPTHRQLYPIDTIHVTIQSSSKSTILRTTTRRCSLCNNVTRKNCPHTYHAKWRLRIPREKASRKSFRFQR